MRALSLLLALLLTSLGVVAQEPGPPRPTESVAADPTVDELIAAFHARMNEIRAGLCKAEEAMDAETYGRLMEAFGETPGPYRPRIEAASERLVGTEEAGRGLAWLYRKAREQEERDRLLVRLLAEHGRSAAMSEVCIGLWRSRRHDADVILEDQLACNPHREARGQACFALGERLRRAQRGVERIPAETRECIEKLMERVVSEFADLPHSSAGTIGEAARRTLFQMRRLAIGSIAPDIAAGDLDGVAFKLSDHRGKVIMLDFWGHW